MKAFRFTIKETQTSSQDYFYDMFIEAPTKEEAWKKLRVLSQEIEIVEKQKRYSHPFAQPINIVKEATLIVKKGTTRPQKATPLLPIIEAPISIEPIKE